MCWPPPAPSGGTPPRCCGCCWPRSHRPLRRHPPNAAPRGRVPVRQDLLVLAPRRILDLRRHPVRPGHPRMGHPGREPRRRRAFGTGKSHFIEALAHAAIEKDLKVASFTLETLATAIARAKADGSVARTVTRICRSDLIVVDLSGVASDPSVTSASVA